MKNQITPHQLRKIKSFWNWFTKNETQIIKALVSDYEEEILTELNKKLSYVSKRIGFFYDIHNSNPVIIKLTISSIGYSKLFPKIEALVQHAPRLEMWLFQALIQPNRDLKKFKLGTDTPFAYRGVILKISELSFSITDLNNRQKKMSIKVYIKQYDHLKDNPNSPEAIEMCILDLIGEIYYKKHITSFQLAQMPNKPKNLAPLYELLETVEFLKDLNKRVKVII